MAHVAIGMLLFSIQKDLNDPLKSHRNDLTCSQCLKLALGTAADRQPVDTDGIFFKIVQQKCPDTLDTVSQTRRQKIRTRLEDFLGESKNKNNNVIDDEGRPDMIAMLHVRP